MVTLYLKPKPILNKNNSVKFPNLLMRQTNIKIIINQGLIRNISLIKDRQTFLKQF